MPEGMCHVALKNIHILAFGEEGVWFAPHRVTGQRVEDFIWGTGGLECQRGYHCT